MCLALVSTSPRGFAFGVGVAWAVSLLEAAGVICLALNRCIRLAVPVHLVILITGIVMVHGPEGWFVVGGGRNGVEYSVLLIMCLVTLFLADRQSRQPLLERALVPR